MSGPGSEASARELSAVPMLISPSDKGSSTTMSTTSVASTPNAYPPGTVHLEKNDSDMLESTSSDLHLPELQQVEWDYSTYNIRKKEVASQVLTLVEGASVKSGTLFFDSPKVEQSYLFHVNTRSTTRIRIILLLASIFYALWSITDFIIFPDEAWEIVPLRFAVVGASAIVLLCSFARNRFHQPQWLFQFVLVVLVVVALVMTAIIDYVQNEQTFANMETTGFVMLLAGTTFLLRVVFLYAAVATNLFVVVWGCLAISLGASKDENVTRLIVRILIVIGANIIFTLASYESEKRQRADYKHSVLLMCRHYNALHQLRELDRMMDKNGDFNMSAPVESILSAVRDVSKGDNLIDVQREQLHFVDQLLRGSRNIYLPNISEQLQHGAIVDPSMNAWLQQLQPLHAGSRTPRRSTLSLLKNQQGMSQATSQSVLQVLGSSTDLLAGSLDEEDHRKLQRQLRQWSFPIFDFEKRMTGTRLPWAVISACNEYGLLAQCNIDKDTLKAFLTAVDLGYKPEIAYHNVMHAVDVVHACNYFLGTGGLADNLRPIDCFNLLISAAIHDYDHPGYTGAYAIQNSTNLALLYNDRSPLENHHVAQASMLLAQDDLDIFARYTDEERQLCRTTIIDLVLATDLKQHFRILATFRSRFADRSYMHSDREDRLALMRLVIKCSDVSNLTKTHDTMIEWTGRFFEESYAQGDLERSKGVKVSPFCDRQHKEEGKCETAFIQFIIEPLFNDFGDVYKKIVPEHAEEYDEVILGNLKRNTAYWKDVQLRDEDAQGGKVQDFD